MNIIAVTVTYNSSNYLRRCIESLENQTFNIKSIIVVDNNSRSDEKEKIHEIVSCYNNVNLLELKENTGGAGGFESGMKKALEENPDWVWIMDDDAHPRKNCLEELLKYKDYPNVGCICPAIFGDELNEFQIYHHKKMTRLFRDIPAYKSFNEFPEFFQVDANAFVGPLISIDTIKNVGVADGGLFIYGDDTEYIYRISQKYKVIVVKNAIINHRDVVYTTETVNPNTWWKDYYMYRNRFLFNSKYAVSNFQKCAVSLRLRFEVFIKIWSTRLRKKFKGYRKIRISLLKAAIKDGSAEKYGKTIDPAKYFKMISSLNKG